MVIVVLKDDHCCWISGESLALCHTSVMTASQKYLVSCYMWHVVDVGTPFKGNFMGCLVDLIQKLTGRSEPQNSSDIWKHKPNFAIGPLPRFMCLFLAFSRAAVHGSDMTTEAVALVNKHDFDPDEVSRCCPAEVCKKLIYHILYTIYFSLFLL